MPQPPPATIPRRTLHEFRGLWTLWRVRIPLGILNLGAVAAGIWLASDQPNIEDKVLVTVGALAIVAVGSAAVILLLAWAISPHRILKDCVTALEVKGGEAGASTPMIQQAQTVNVYQGGTIGPRSRPEVEMGELELGSKPPDEDAN